MKNPDITIDLDKFTLVSNCKNGHILNDLSFSDFNKYCFKTINITLEICSSCFCNLNNNENNYICLTCNRLLCRKCINNHKEIENHYNNTNHINSFMICNKHNSEYIFFCNECKINICQECAISHNNHLIKPLSDIIPNNQKKELMNLKIQEKENKIIKIIDSIKEIKKNIDERFKKIDEYLSFLKNIIKIY